MLTFLREKLKKKMIIIWGVHPWGGGGGGGLFRETCYFSNCWISCLSNSLTVDQDNMMEFKWVEVQLSFVSSIQQVCAISWFLILLWGGGELKHSLSYWFLAGLKLKKTVTLTCLGPATYLLTGECLHHICTVDFCCIQNNIQKEKKKKHACFCLFSVTVCFV